MNHLEKRKGITLQLLKEYKAEGKPFKIRDFCRDAGYNIEWLRHNPALGDMVYGLWFELDRGRAKQLIVAAIAQNPTADDGAIASITGISAVTVTRYRGLMKLAQNPSAKPATYLRSPLQEARTAPVESDVVQRCLNIVLAHMRRFGRRLEKEHIASICGIGSHTDDVVVEVLSRLKVHPNVLAERKDCLKVGPGGFCKPVKDWVYSWKVESQQEAA